jgi:ABC-2 type transport system ATP-binding protein
MNETLHVRGSTSNIEVEPLCAIRIENMCKSFGETLALKNLDLEIAEGEIFGLLGPNGAGKTTTIKLVTGLLRPTSGNVFIKGINISQEPREAKKKLALVPDVPYLYKKLTGWEFMKFIARIYEIERRDIDAEIESQLGIFNIAQVAHDLIDSYSHGMRQRLLLASVMIRDPEIIVLDEPMVGLDPEAARMVKNMFKELSLRKKTIFLSTHTLSDAQELCGRIAIINKGELLALGSIEELKGIASRIKGDLTEANLENIYLSITGKNE